MIDRRHVKETFAVYTDGYDSSDEKIRLKIEHTYRVAELCDQIAESLQLSAEDQDLAWLLGMLHDVGRFEQVRRYGTFYDNLSVDHAKFGADLLFEEDLISRFLPDGYGRMGLLEVAIRQHNVYRLREDLTEEEQLFCDLIRDADKIDIMKVSMDSPMEVVYGVTTEELEHSQVTAAVMEQYFAERCVLKSIRQTAADILAGHASLAFELVYPRSRQIAAEQGYVFQMLDYPSRNPVTRQQLAEMKEKMKHFLQ